MIKVMKKFLLVLLVVNVLSLTGCWGNRDIFDDVTPSSNTWTYAEVQMPDGTVKEGVIKSWADYDSGDAIKIIFVDGTEIITSYNKAVLSKRKVDR